ncbi:MAG: MASE3 domain-containing protein [Desulfomonilaceae bacterium]|nr:MASE3 domain-containing protein [Desulfomonilaceae bacterium]
MRTEIEPDHTYSRVPDFALATLILAALYVTSQVNFLLFHSLVESFSIAVGLCIFALAWNSRQFLKSDYLLFLGIAYLFVAWFDFFHMLAYKGMGVFAGEDPNPSTQLWIAARYLESTCLLIAPSFLTRKLNPTALFVVFTMFTALVFASLFYWKIFPDCFVEGVGLTGFKIVSEYVICAILLGALGHLLVRRDHVDPGVLRLLVASLLLTVASELAFTFYVSVYGLSNALGHFLKIVSFYLIYRAIVHTGIRDPYAILFRQLDTERRNLLESEQRYRSLVNLSPTGIAVVSDGEVVFANDEAGKIFGYRDGKDLLGTRMPQIESASPAEPFHASFPSGEPDWASSSREENLIRQNGSLIEVELAAVPLTFDGKSAMQVVLRDVTDRKAAENALMSERQRLFMVFDVIPGYVCLQGSDYTIRFANGKYHQLFGNPDGMPCYRIMKGRDEPCEICPPHQVLEDGKEAHWEWDTSGGRTFVVHAYPFTDLDGSKLVLEMGIDVTDQAVLRRELQKNRDMLNSLLQAAPICIGMIGGGTLQWVNEFTCEMLGYETDELVGKNLRLLYESEEEFKRVRSTNLAMLQEQETASLETRWVHKDGSVSDILLTSSLVQPGQPATGMVATAVDITERKNAEKRIKASLGEKEVLLREIHHRVKNNLALVSTLLGLQSDHAADETHRTMFEDCGNRVRSMAQAHELLYRSDNLECLDVREYVENLLDHLILSIGSIGAPIQIKKEIEGVSFGLDTAIPVGFLLTELLSNCLKHAFPTGGAGEITISLRAVDRDEFELRVADNGIGMPEDIDLENPSTMGMDLIDTFVHKLRGSMRILHHKGTEVRIRFKGV